MVICVRISPIVFIDLKIFRVFAKNHKKFLKLVIKYNQTTAATLNDLVNRQSIFYY